MRVKVRRRETRSGVRWYLSLIDDSGHEEAHGGFTTKREAKDRAAELLTDSRRGGHVSPSRMTVADYLLGEWAEARQNADLSPNARDVERLMVEAWIVPHLGETRLQRLAPRDLDRLYSLLRQRGGRGGKPLRGKSVRNAHVLLHKALGDAVRRGYLAANPAAAVSPPSKDDSVERTAWTKDEVRRFLDVASRDRLAAVWRLALATGARRGELLGLTWADVEDGAVTVARQVLVRPRKVKDERRIYVREATKSRRVRKVAFDADTGAALRRWKAEQARERLAFGGAWKDDGGLGLEAAWIVTEPSGHVVHPDTLRERFRALARKAGVPEIPLHAARHSYATLALAAGVRLDIVSRQLGHASIAITADVYGHPDDEATAEAAARMGDVLANGGSEAP